MKSLLVPYCLVAFCTFANAYFLSFYGSVSCRGVFIERQQMKADSGCQRNHAGVAGSAVVSVDENNKDLGNVVLFFQGDDCKPSDIMQDGEAFVFEDGCWTGNYGSYEVWELWNTEV